MQNRILLFFSAVFLALALVPLPVCAQDMGSTAPYQGISAEQNPGNLTPDQIKALGQRYGVQGERNVAPAASQTSPFGKVPQASPSQDTTIPPARTEGGRISPPTEKSAAEEFFSQPQTSLGQAIGGSTQAEELKSQEAKQKAQMTPQELQQQKLQQDAQLARLISAGPAMDDSQKVNLFLQLDTDHQQTYLQNLPLQDRQAFLKSLGDKGRYYLEDLQVAPIDRDLKQFGYDFFTTSKGGYAPDQFGPVGPDYVVGPGDTLNISIWGNIEGNYQLTVDRSGDIVLPKVGAIQIWGQTFSQAKATIHQQVAKYFSHFQMNVTMGALRSIQVYIVGEVNSPGSYTVSSLSTVLSALVAADGPTKNGSLRDVRLVRGGKVVDTIDFYDFFLKGDRSHDARLQSGDTIHVPVVGPLVGIAGNVRHPAIFELKNGESLRDVLRLAGGVTSTAYLKRVLVERVVAHQKKVALDVDLSDLDGKGNAESVTLQDRDLVEVSPISPVSTSYVKLKGYAARPGRYQFIKGMHLSDLILPYDNLLPETFRGMAEVLRLQPPDYQPQKLTVDLGKALAGDPSQNIELEKFDEVRLFSTNQMAELPQVQVTGAVLTPGAYRLYDKMTVKDLVAAAGNLKRSAYLAGAELMRFTPSGEKTLTSRIVFNLKKALQGDPKENLVLQPEDHLFVRSIPDFAERQTVTLQGEVLFPGTYAIAKGETLSSVLQRAGGFTSHAYLRGATFSRESVKQIQQQRIDKLIQQQEQQVLLLSTQMAQGAMSQADVQASQALLQTRKQMTEKLRQVQVTGRVVVQLAPLDKFRGTPADIQLVGGDTLTVPDNPRSVSVLGEVYNPTALTFQPGFSVAQYLDEVGGPTGNADTDEMFIVRADGTVYSRQQAGMGVKWDSENHRWISGGFNTAVLYPGDTILVPEKVETSAILKNTKDITQIIYQMALGAAAVASF